MMKRQLFHVKMYVKVNLHVYNGPKDFLVKIIELLRFLHFTQLYQELSY